MDSGDKINPTQARNKNPKVRLLEPHTDQAGDYFELFSSAEVCRYFDIEPFTELAAARRFLESAMIQAADRKAIRYTIEADSEIAGTFCFYAIAWHQKRASIGYALKERYWGRGIMGAALRTAEAIAFGELSLNRLQATVLPENASSKRMLAKAGYVYEGLLRDYEYWPGKGFVNLEMYGKLAHDRLLD